MADDPPELAPGERVGRYRIVEELFTGGSFKAYLAEDTVLNRRAVIKIYVSMILPYHAFKTVSDGIGKVNPNERYVIAGTRFPIEALRLDSVDVDWFDTYDAAGNVRTLFVTDFVFSATPGGWFQHTLVRRDGEWDVDTVSEYQTWRTGLKFPWQTSLF